MPPEYNRRCGARESCLREIKPGDRRKIGRDVVVGGRRAFGRGETVVIEKVEPKPARPSYRYVVRSTALDTRFQLSDGHFEPEARRFPSKKTVLAAGGALAAASIAVVALFLAFSGSRGAAYTVWVAGDRGTVLVSVDGGSSWRSGSAGAASLRGIAPAGDGRAVAVGNTAGGKPAIFTADTDAGVEPAREANTQCPPCRLNGVAAYGAGTLIAVGGARAAEDGAVVLRSTDGGANWSAVETDTGDALFAVAAHGSSTSWAAGEGGILLRSSDGGITWRNAGAAGRTLLGVATGDGGFVIAVGTGGTASRSSSSGSAWSISVTKTAEHLYAACADGPRTAWVAGSRGTVLKTEDGGDTWVRQRSGTGENLRGITAVDESTVFAVGDRGTVTRSTDGGKTWRVLEVPLEDNLHSVCTDR